MMASSVVSVPKPRPSRAQRFGSFQFMKRDDARLGWTQRLTRRACSELRGKSVPSSEHKATDASVCTKMSAAVAEPSVGTSLFGSRIKRLRHDVPIIRARHKCHLRWLISLSLIVAFM